MARVKRGVTAHKRHKRLLKAAEGRRGTRSKLIKPAREAQLHAMAYAYRGRKERKRQLRALWIVRLNAAARLNGLTYGTLISGLKAAGRRRSTARSWPTSRSAMRPRSRASPRSPRPSSGGAPHTRGPRHRSAPSLTPCATRRSPSSRPRRRRTRSTRSTPTCSAARASCAPSWAASARSRPRTGRVSARSPTPSARRSRPRSPSAASDSGPSRSSAPRRRARGRHAARSRAWRGGLHPIRETEREIARIFGQFGFVVVESPEVETDELNFEALNIPADHPARDLWDTIYVADPAPPDRPVAGGRRPAGCCAPTRRRARSARCARREPPIRILTPGRCYRYEAVDASHGFEFFQVEGLMVDEGTSMATLRGLLDAFAHAMFGAGRATRFRPGYYPFTEPSVAFDIGCVVCDGAGCPACGRTGWMTILGAGMVHPVVLPTAASTPSATRASPSAWAPTASRCCATPSATSAPSSPTTCASWSGSSRARPAVLAARVRRRRPVARGARRAPDAPGHGGQGHRADRRRLEPGRRRRAARRRAPIPTPTRLSLTTVRVGRRPSRRSRSSAARPTSRVGQRVPVALPGAVLPGDRRIEVTRLAGVESQGMLCSGDELGLIG